MGGVRIPRENDAVAHSNIANLGTKFFHHSNSLAAQSCWKVRFISAGTAVEGLPRKFATSLSHIKKVNAGSFHPHQRFSRAGNRSGEFLPLHDLWTAVGVNTNGVHQVCLPVLPLLVLHFFTSASRTGRHCSRRFIFRAPRGFAGH